MSCRKLNILMPLIKILSGFNFENLLTKVLTISLLWKTGGTYINPSYEYRNFKFDTPANNGWIVKGENIQFLDITYFPQSSDFLWQLSKCITKTFPLDHTPSE